MPSESLSYSSIPTNLSRNTLAATLANIAAVRSLEPSPEPESTGPARWEELKAAFRAIDAVGRKD